jgi:hypothetical protein
MAICSIENRPIDRIDSSDLLRGRSDSSNRDHVLFYGSNGEILSHKWKTMKVVFRYAESTSGPIIKPQLPLIFHLIEDPKEAWDLVQTRMGCAWLTVPAIPRIGSLMKSTAKYPNIKPGQEFEGYKETKSTARDKYQVPNGAISLLPTRSLAVSFRPVNS